jgi:hypothetical protein
MAKIKFAMPDANIKMNPMIRIVPAKLKSGHQK